MPMCSPPFTGQPSTKTVGRGNAGLPGISRLLGVMAIAALNCLSPAAPAAPATRPAVPRRLPPPPYRPVPRAVPDDPSEVTDEQIDLAIRRGANFLYARFRPANRPRRIEIITRRAELHGQWDYVDDEALRGGVDSLAVYALLQCGLTVDDPRFSLKHDEMKRLVEAMKSYSLGGGRFQTYSRAIRATALAVYNRPEDHDVLDEDAQWLIDACDGGAYTYQLNRDLPSRPIDAALNGSANHLLTDEVERVLNRGPASQPADGAAGSHPYGEGPATQPIRLGGIPRPAGNWDNSNSQYGLLAVWSAAEAGVEVPQYYWEMVERHWTETQGKDGDWTYKTGYPRNHPLMFSMGAMPGLASLLVTHDYLEPARFGDQVGRDPYSPPVRKILADMDRGVGSMVYKSGYGNYTAERVGLATGFKHFGATDWYRQMAKFLISNQRPDGSWGIFHAPDPFDFEIDYETSFNLLCLARGRHPVLMTKLRFDGNEPFHEDVPGPGVAPVRPAPARPVTGAGPAATPRWVGYWANRPHDAAHLARFAGGVLERQFNWQVVSVDRDWTEWNDSPVLELASRKAPQFTPGEIDKIRNFILAGGLLFTQADGGSAEFNDFAAKLARELFPQYDLVDVPPGHPLYTNETVYNVNPRPPLKMVSNGARVLMLYSPADVARWWQTRDEIRHRDAFEFGINLFVYASGKQDFRKRLKNAWVTAPPVDPLATVRLARVSYGGNWDPEPLAWERFSNWLQRRTGTRLAVAPTAMADLGGLKPAECPVAHLTGTFRQRFTDDEAAAARAYVQAGGVLLIDNCGGTGPFDQSAEALLSAAFPGDPLQPLPVHHPLLRATYAGTEDVSRPLVRAEAARRYGRGAGALKVISSGRGHVLYTPMDLSAGLLGTNTVGVVGYDPAYASALAKNVLFWALDGQAEK